MLSIFIFHYLNNIVCLITMEEEITKYIPQVEEKWKSQTIYDKPKYLFAIMNNQVFIVVDDSGSLLRLLNFSGFPYITPKGSCDISNDIYNCKNEPNPLNNIILSKDRFVNDNILTLFPEN